MLKKVLILCLVALPFLIAPDAPAKFFKYRDENGRLFFVDDESKIPLQYRVNKTTYNEELDHLTPLQRKTVLEQRRRNLIREKEQERKREEQVKRKKYLQSLRTRVEIEGKAVYVPVEIKHGWKKVTLNLVLDTGASMTVFHKDAVSGLEIKEAELGYGQGVGGYTFTVEKVKFRHIKVGPFTEEGMTAAIIHNYNPSPRHDGLLGMDFLMKHNYRIDYKNQLILWEPEIL
jgi:Aspartyl protease